MAFQNPANGYIETVPDRVWLWVLLFGGIYFLAKGVWTHAAASLATACVTFGISWLVYPFFAKQIMVAHYLHNGWIRV